MSEITTNIIQDESEKVKVVSNPFPGLRPFGIDESHLFFGREGQSDEVLVKLSQNKFVAVIGSSGSGKSSFMYCGVIPILYGGFLTQAGSNWNIVAMRPGSGPIDNLAEALLKSNIDYLLAEGEEKTVKKTITTTLLKGSSLGLVEAVGQLKSSQSQNVLILVDQFEELFRFKKSEEGYGNESLAFVNLLLEATRSSSSIFIAITMRSDFIGECAQFPELTKLINDSHYLIPQMTREQKRNAIVGPVAVGGATVAPRLVQQLLNDLGDNPDQLPILQHSLMRTWTYWETNHQSGESLDLHHYEAIGGMKEALSQHANEAYEELTERQKELCAHMFKALTEKGSESSGIRRPTKLGTIAAICNASEEEIKAIIERFRQPGRSLLTPPAGVPLLSNTVVDISHESLMRIWVRLKVWVEEEGEAVSMYLRLSDAAAMYQQGKTSLWRPPDLQLALNWKDKHKPTLVWAQRYNPAFERTMVFLETSKQEYETEQKIKEMLQQRKLRTTRIIAAVLGTAAVISIGLLIFAINQTIKAEHNATEAIKQKGIAEDQKKVAVAEKKKAEVERQRAEEEKQRAEEEKKHAEEEKQRAEEETKRAETNEQLAKANERLAKANERLAKANEKLAKENQKEAEKQKDLADKNADKAYKLRLLSIAQSMAVKSLQIEDTARRGVIAMQAYKFHSENGGSQHNHDIYDGLYYALKFLKVPDYNNMKGHSKAVRSVTFTADGKELFTAGSDGKIMRWDVETQKGFVLYQNKYVNRVLSLSADNKWLAVGGEASSIQLFNLSDSIPTPTILRGHKGAITALAFTNDGLISSSVSDSMVFRWNLEERNYTVIEKCDSKIKTLAVANGKIGVATEAGQVFLLDGDQKTVLQEKGRANYSLSFGNKGEWLAAGDDVGTVKIWSISEKKLINTLVGQKARINDIKFSKDSRFLATASFDASVNLYNMENLNEQPIRLRDHDSWAWSMTFSPDGKKLVVGCVDKLIRVWPTSIDLMANQMCDKLKRNMTGKEWERYVAPTNDIPYQKTCTQLQSKEGIKED